jgi:hypothetical protein
MTLPGVWSTVWTRNVASLDSWEPRRKTVMVMVMMIMMVMVMMMMMIKMMMMMMMMIMVILMTRVYCCILLHIRAIKIGLKC